MEEKREQKTDKWGETRRREDLRTQQEFFSPPGRRRVPVMRKSSDWSHDAAAGGGGAGGGGGADGISEVISGSVKVKVVTSGSSSQSSTWLPDALTRESNIKLIPNSLKWLQASPRRPCSSTELWVFSSHLPDSLICCSLTWLAAQICRSGNNSAAILTEKQPEKTSSC